LSLGEEPLARALCKNILDGADVVKARRLAIYAETAIAGLTGLDEVTLLGAAWTFPSPAGAGAQH
jgi:cytochrome b pre-mRNA-processing protein 3